MAVLAELAVCDHTERAAAALRLELAVTWAGMHPGIADQPYDAVTDSLVDETTGVAVAAIAEFAAVHGISTNAGRQLIADAVALHDRLPRCWQHMNALQLPAWKARLLAQAAHSLGDAAVAWLDNQATVLGAKLGVRTIRRLALLARARFEPDSLTDPNQHRWVRINPDTGDSDGAAWLDGRLDTPDALDLDAALRLIAADLSADGVDADLDVRRAQALGVMARRMLGQPDLPTDAAASAADGTGQDESEPRDQHDPTSPNAVQAGQAGRTDDTVTGLDPGPIGSPDPRGRLRNTTRGGRPVSIYMHFDAAQLTDDCGGLGELGNTGQLVTSDQLRAWCGTAGTITIRPVIDLNHSRATRSYQPTEVMREHLALRDRTCVFPHCTRTAHPVRRRSTGEYGHDADHVVPYQAGGQTSTDNLACLCRSHHLLKTHTSWRYDMIGHGEYLWTSPTGQRLLRTDSGTTLLNGPQPRGKPRAA